jgi:hypothetical protein
LIIPVLFRGKVCWKRRTKTGSYILTDILHKQPEKTVGYIFKPRFGEVKYKLEHNIKKLTVSGLGLKRKRRQKIDVTE